MQNVVHKTQALRLHTSRYGCKPLSDRMTIKSHVASALELRSTCPVTFLHYGNRGHRMLLEAAAAVPQAKVGPEGLLASAATDATAFSP